MGQRVKTPWAVRCPEHGLVYLTRQEYNLQMRKADSLWECPICLETSVWDDDNYEVFLEEGESDD